jgi:glycine/sarcosine N-methyltransferase
MECETTKRQAESPSQGTLGPAKPNCSGVEAAQSYHGAPMTGALEFYTELSDEYAEQFPDWQAETLTQGRLLERVIRRECRTAPSTVLDCACGIGTQAIGLARVGFHVVGTDLCPSAIECARSNAAALAQEIDFHVSSFADLGAQLSEQFDVVCCCDNAIPHLLEEKSILEALRAMHHRLVKGGLLVLSIRDYDEALRLQVKGTVPQMFDGVRGRRIIFQIWQWKTPVLYTLQHFIMRYESGVWNARQYTVDYRAIKRRDLTRLLRKARFEGIQWHMPDETGYHQPVVTARSSRLSSSSHKAGSGINQHTYSQL